MDIHVLTLFPGMFVGPFSESLMGKAQEKNILRLETVNIRDFATDKHKSVDDYPYGGGAGMVMKPEPIFRAVESICPPAGPRPPIILMTPQGRVFNQKKAIELAREPRLIIICGHYEGVDERVREHLVTDEISLGDFVLTGGELAAMVVIETVARLLPGVVKEQESIVEDSFYQGLLEYPHYTRPLDFRGHRVPEVLVSGHHEQIRLWRRKESLRRTYLRRPDLLEALALTGEDRKLLAQIKVEEGRERGGYLARGEKRDE